MQASLTGGMKQTFLEGFAKIYAYPYGNSFLPRDTQAFRPYDEATVGIEHTTTGASVFERTIQRKRQLRPFHVDCGVTKRRVCYCPSTGVHEKVEVKQQMQLASDLLNYYEGYEPDLPERFQRKVSQQANQCSSKLSGSASLHPRGLSSPTLSRSSSTTSMRMITSTNRRWSRSGISSRSESASTASRSLCLLRLIIHPRTPRR